jgi:putative salt-induced outer membrane protein YdiY
VGGNLLWRRTEKAWKYETGALLVRAADGSRTTAARYGAHLTGERQVSERLGATGGLRLERDRLAGLNLRSLLSAGLSYGLVRRERLLVDTRAAVTWNHEDQRQLGARDNAGLALEALGTVTLSPTAQTTQRLAVFPNLVEGDDYRLEGEVALSATINTRFAVELAYLLRYDNRPVPTFEHTDTTATASIVFKVQGTR